VRTGLGLVTAIEFGSPKMHTQTPTGSVTGLSNDSKTERNKIGTQRCGARCILTTTAALLCCREHKLLFSWLP
jgi:hypothetical protein